MHDPSYLVHDQIRDASQWAEEFIKMFPIYSPPEEIMLVWFASAIETGYELGRRSNARA